MRAGNHKSGKEMMSKPANKPPFRADHVGSLLRPAELTEARAKWEAGTLSPEDLKAVEDKCILDAIALQEGVGLKGITDGDFRRNDWFLDFMYSLEGIEKGGAGMYVPFSGGLDYYAPKTVFTGKVKCPEGGIMVDAFRFLKDHTKETAKICIPAPAMFNTVMSESMLEDSPYDSIEEFWDDIGTGYAEAVQHLAAAGCTYLQIDDVNSANLGDPKWQAVWQSQGRSPMDVCNNSIKLNNAALDARPDGVTAAVHMCRGNYQSEYAAEGGYDVIAETYFNSMHVDAFFMEYDDARSGTFEPLRFMAG